MNFQHICPTPGFDSNENSHSKVFDPHPHDVLCGRGAVVNNYVGNITWRRMVSENKPKYYSLSTKREKTDLSRQIVDTIRNQVPPGRFLKKDTKSGFWFDVGDSEARRKTSQALREKTAIEDKKIIDKASSKTTTKEESNRKGCHAIITNTAEDNGKKIDDSAECIEGLLALRHDVAPAVSREKSRRKKPEVDTERSFKRRKKNGNNIMNGVVKNENIKISPQHLPSLRCHSQRRSKNYANNEMQLQDLSQLHKIPIGNMSVKYADINLKANPDQSLSTSSQLLSIEAAIACRFGGQPNFEHFKTMISLPPPAHSTATNLEAYQRAQARSHQPVMSTLERLQNTETFKAVSNQSFARRFNQLLLNSSYQAEKLATSSKPLLCQSNFVGSRY